MHCWSLQLPAIQSYIKNAPIPPLLNGLPSQYSFFLLLCLFVVCTAGGQATDSTKSAIPKTWDKFNIGLRLGAGVQRSFFTEAGISLQRYVCEAHEGFMVLTGYAAIEWTPARPGEKPVYGIKAGAELVNNGAVGGFEIKWLGNSLHEDLVFTPRFGVGLGVANILYGYNISTKKYPFPKIGRHQFSLVINTNIFLHHLKYKSD